MRRKHSAIDIKFDDNIEIFLEKRIHNSSIQSLQQHWRKQTDMVLYQYWILNLVAENHSFWIVRRLCRAGGNVVMHDEALEKWGKTVNEICQMRELRDPAFKLFASDRQFYKLAWAEIRPSRTKRW